MRSTIYILIATVVLTSFGCEKLKPTYTMEGFLYYSCSKDPVVQAPLELNYQRGGFSGSGTFDVTTTDSKGYFKFEYKPKSGAQMYILPGKGYGGGIVRQIPLEPYIDLGEVYMSEAGKVAIILKVTNSYSNLDTLYLTASSSMNYDIILPGPFSTYSIGIVEVPKNSERIYPLPPVDKGTVKWHINEVNKFNFEQKDFDLHGCGVVDSVTIEI